MANEVIPFGGGESPITPLYLVEITGVDTNDFTVDIPFSPRKIVLIQNATGDVQITQWFGMSATGFNYALRGSNSANNAGVFHTAPCFAVAANSNGGYTVTVDASEALIASGAAVLIEFWR